MTGNNTTASTPAHATTQANGRTLSGFYDELSGGRRLSGASRARLRAWLGVLAGLEDWLDATEPPPSRGSAAASLSAVPTDELIAECHRRGLVVLDGARARVLPGLIIHPGGRVLRWRGADHALPPTLGRIVVALGALWPRPIEGRALSMAVWGPHVDENNARVHVRELRRRCPGLVETVGYSGYRLALTESGSAVPKGSPAHEEADG